MLNRLSEPRVALLLLLMSCSASAERYQVTTDEDGSAQVKPVETQSAKQLSGADGSDEHTADQEPDTSLPVTTSKRLRVRGISDAPYETQDPTPSLIDKAEIPATDQTDENNNSGNAAQTTSPSVFEQRLLESEGKTREELLKDLENKSLKEREKVIVLDGVRYVDGEALLDDESLAEEGARYFTTIDMDGRAHNVYFSPEMEKRARKELREKKIQYTSATEYLWQDEVTKAKPAASQIASADSGALAILGAASPNSYFSEFQEYCCHRLPNRIAHDLESGVPLFFDIKNDDAPYRFSEGDSRYVLIRLPEDTEDLAVRVRSFIKEFRKQGINHGVFYPQVTLLSKEKKPLRMIRDASFDFSGETWSNYGYLQGLFRINRKIEGAEEFFLLLHTDRASLNKSSYFEMDQEQIQVQHMQTGSLSVEIVSQNRSEN